jgi:hypothetical protein
MDNVRRASHKSSVHHNPKTHLLGTQSNAGTQRRQPNGTGQLRRNLGITLETAIHLALQQLQIKQPTSPMHCNQRCVVVLNCGKTNMESVNIGRWLIRVS